MKSITVDSNNQHYEAENGVLFTKNKIKLIQYPLNKEDKKYTLPESTTEIEKYAFTTCCTIKHLKIGEGIEVISDYAFQACANLESVSIPTKFPSRLRLARLIS